MSEVNLNKIKNFGIKYENMSNVNYNDTVVLKKIKKGLGVSIGNAIRRTMIQYCEGYAIVEYSIQGVQHEFSSISGLKEDAQKLIINLAKVIFSGSAKTGKATLNINKAGEVYANQITSDLQIVNSEEYICTLTEDIELHITMSLKKSYSSVVLNSINNGVEVNSIIPAVACFSPIINVNVEIASSFDEFEDLTLTIETNGSISPKEAFEYAYSVYFKQLQEYIKDTGAAVQDEVVAPEVKENKAYLNVLNKKIVDFIDKDKILNCLKSMEIDYLGQLVQLTEDELMKQPKMGKKSVEILKMHLSNLGLKLGMETDWKMPNQNVGVIQSEIIE